MPADNDTPLRNKILPSRQAAKLASVNFAEQLASSPVQSDNESYSRPRGGGGVKIKYGTKRGRQRSPSKATSASTRLPVSPALRKPKPASVSTPVTIPRARPRPKFAGKKRASEATFSSGEDSDIVFINRTQSPTPRSLTQIRSFPSVKASIARPHVPASRRKSFPELAMRRSQHEEECWSVKSLGTYVWVLVDKRARAFEPDDEGDEAKTIKERIWWPGKIKSVDPTETPLAISTFGTVSPGIGSSIEIHSPSVKNILPMTNLLGRVRFDAPAFVSSLSMETAGISPRKKQKHDRGDIEDRWQQAVSEMVMEKEDDEDGLPDVGLAYSVSSLYASASSPARGVERNQPIKVKANSRKRKGNARGYRSDDGMDIDTEEERWSPPPQDDSLHIPGELVLARDNRARYWPAQLLEYIPPKKRNQKAGAYRVLYLDETQAVLPRRSFHSAEEDEFGTCLLGEFESCYRDVVNDNSDEENSADEGDAAGPNRPPSPLPTYPPPSPTSFTLLSVPEQFAYTKNVLQAILQEQYEPARMKHDMYIGGGQGRKLVVDEAGMRGKMDPKDVDKLERCLRGWCLREERWAVKMVDEGDGGDQELSVDAVTPLEMSTTTNRGLRNGSTEPDDQDYSPLSLVTENTSMSFAQGVPSSSSLGSIGGGVSAGTETGEPTSPSSSILTVLSEPSVSRRMSNNESRSTILSPEHSQDTIPDENKKECDTNNNISPTRRRQQGCPAYEALSGVERVDYCLNVLLPEAILQLLLWRSGNRTSVELLSDEEEQALHDVGEEKLRETDWVFDVMRLRESKVRQLARAAGKRANEEGPGDMTNRGTISRPKRNTGPRRY